jgi:hypothetical protein
VKEGISERIEVMTDRLAISFWIWGLFDTVPNGFFDDLEGRIVELGAGDGEELGEAVAVFAQSLDQD